MIEQYYSATCIKYGWSIGKDVVRVEWNSIWSSIVQYVEQEKLFETIFRLLLALGCGGILGIERGRKRRPAGFRTYILVCVGATLVMITNEHLCDIYGYGDPARLGAQVVSGIGFLGAGTIVVTGRNRVKGLTTAAGLWAAACMGLTIGVGYYSAAIVGCIMIFIVMAVLHSLDARVMSSTKVINLYVEFGQLGDVGGFVHFAKDQEMRVSDLEMTRSTDVNDATVAILVTLHLPKKTSHAEIIQMLSGAKGVRYVEEVG